MYGRNRNQCITNIYRDCNIISYLYLFLVSVFPAQNIIFTKTEVSVYFVLLGIPKPKTAPGPMVGAQ